MRYHIDTIPVWDAVKLDGECPLCALRRKLELGEVERFLERKTNEAYESCVRVEAGERLISQRGFQAQDTLLNQLRHWRHDMILLSSDAEVIAVFHGIVNDIL